MDIYEPAEDSYLLQKHIGRYAQGRVLDVGTGSGIQALTAIKNSSVREVIAVDINEKAIEKLKNTIKEKKLRKIKAIKSDLFENVSGVFNLIIFNPPYLPQDKGLEDTALYGGKKGWEISKRLFEKAAKYLSVKGKILFLFSTLTDKKKIEEIINNNLFDFKQVGSQKLAFEELFVYEISKSELLKELEKHHLENVHYFTKGKRGLIYLAEQDKKNLIKSHLSKSKKIKVAIKVNNPKSQAIGRIENEVKWLKVLNKQGIGPKLLFSNKDFFIYKFIEGEHILDWLKNHDKREIIIILKNILEQCLKLDKLKITKEEMHHPHKHIVVDKDNIPTLIDFERTHLDEKPQNVTQFLEFLCRIKEELIKKDIEIKSEKIRQLAKKYKKIYNLNILKGIFPKNHL